MLTLHSSNWPIMRETSSRSGRLKYLMARSYAKLTMVEGAVGRGMGTETLQTSSSTNNSLSIVCFLSRRWEVSSTRPCIYDCTCIRKEQIAMGQTWLGSMHCLGGLPSQSFWTILLERWSWYRLDGSLQAKHKETKNVLLQTSVCSGQGAWNQVPSVRCAIT